MRIHLLAALALLAGCPSPSSPSSSCDCEASEFCCLGTCLALGSTCPPIDATPSDAPSDGAPGDDAPAIDCAPRPAPSGGSAPSASRCMGEAIWYCAGEPTPCGVGHHCVEWLDAGANTFRAACVDSDSVPCDPEEGDTCDGASTLRVCRESLGDPTVVPPGLAVAVDCADAYGPESTCLDDASGARCTVSSCDPETFVSTCVAEDRFSTCTADATLRYQRCGPTLSCIANDLTAPEAACIPRGAPTSETRSAERTVLGCIGAALLVAQWGYEWGEPCGALQECRGTGASARCVVEGAEPCDGDTFTPVCRDAIREVRCVDGYTVDGYCGIGLVSGSVPSACDETTGACVPTRPCGGARAEHCDPSGRFRIHCEDALGREVAEPCADCTDDGRTVTCG